MSLNLDRLRGISKPSIQRLDPLKAEVKPQPSPKPLEVEEVETEPNDPEATIVERDTDIGESIRLEPVDRNKLRGRIQNYAKRSFSREANLPKIP